MEDNTNLGDALAEFGEAMQRCEEANEEQLQRSLDMIRGKNIVHKDDLRELIDKWLTESTTYRPGMSTDERATMLDCANQLEELIKDE